MRETLQPCRTLKLTVGEGRDARPIAILWREATRPDLPTLVWLGGYRSDMTGTKAIEMDRFAGARGAAALRFDYSGHGASGGEFREGTISRWLEESLAVIDHLKPQSLLLLGSSMGGWIALRLAQVLRQRADAPGGEPSPRLAGMVLIAPAPDFTSALIEPGLGDQQRADLEQKGYIEEASDYSPEPNVFTRALIEDGRRNRVLDGLIATGCPVTILQGMADPDVPYQHALRLLDHLPSEDVVLTLVRDGDHRLSRTEDLARMRAAIDALLDTAR